MLDAIKQQIIDQQPKLYYVIGEGIDAIYKVDTPGHNPADCTWIIPPDDFETLQEVTFGHAVKMIDMNEYTPTEAEQLRAMQIVADKMSAETRRRRLQCLVQESSS